MPHLIAWAKDNISFMYKKLPLNYCWFFFFTTQLYDDSPIEFDGNMAEL